MKKSISSKILIPIALLIVCLAGLIVFRTFNINHAPQAMNSFGAIRVRTVKAPTFINQNPEQAPLAMINPLDTPSPDPFEQELTTTQTITYSPVPSLTNTTIPTNTETNTATPTRTATDIPTLTPSPTSSPTATNTPTSTNIPIQKSRIEKFEISMPQLENRQRKIQVYLPPNYDLTDLSYPVLYFFDGDSLFNPPPERVGDYLMDETLDRLYEEELTEGVIVVGIEYDPAYPWSENMPWINPNMHDWVKAKNSEPTEGGEGEAFLNFILDTLKPEIDSRYRTLPDAANTMIGGPCRNGLIPLYAGISRPDVFLKVMLLSPAVWLAESGGPWLSNNQLIDFIKNNEVPADLRVYIDIGTEESSGNQPRVYDQNGKRITYPQAYVEGAKQVYLTLLSRGISEDNFRFEIFEGAAGTRDEWAKRFDEAILWLTN